MILVASLLPPAVNSAYDQMSGALNDLGRVVILGVVGFVGLRIVFWLCGATFDTLFKAPRASTLPRYANAHASKPATDDVPAPKLADKSEGQRQSDDLGKSTPRWDEFKLRCAYVAIGGLVGLVAGALAEHNSDSRGESVVSNAPLAYDRAAYTYTLYRTSLSDGSRLHVATFDATDGDWYNSGNCDIARGLFQEQPGVSVRYWCEKGLFRR